jgi:hypothetical protein
MVRSAWTKDGQNSGDAAGPSSAMAAMAGGALCARRGENGSGEGDVSEEGVS